MLLLVVVVKTKFEKDKTLLVDKAGVGRFTVDKKFLELLEWEHGDKIEMVADMKSGEICIIYCILTQKDRRPPR